MDRQLDLKRTARCEDMCHLDMEELENTESILEVEEMLVVCIITES